MPRCTSTTKGSLLPLLAHGAQDETVGHASLSYDGRPEMPFRARPSATIRRGNDPKE